MTRDQAEEDLMTRRQVAFLFQMTSQAVVRLARRGRLTEVRNCDGKPRYRRAEVEELFRSSFSGGESPDTGPGPAGEQAGRTETPPLEPAGDMARDGVFFRKAGSLNSRSVPGAALTVQGIWACLLCLSGTYGDLLDYVIATVLIFYIATIVGRWKLARTVPALAPGSLGDRLVPILYVAATSYVTVALAIYKPAYTIPGLVIVALGVPAFFVFRRKATA